MIKEVLLTIVYLGTHNHVSNHDLIAKMERASKTHIVLEKVIREEDFAPELNTIDRGMKRFGSIKDHVQNDLGIAPNSIVLVYVNPLIDINGRAWDAGIASNVCNTIDGVGIVWGTDKNTRATAMHELGHLLGAWHDNHVYSYGFSIMNYAVVVGQKEVKFSAQSVREMRNCNQ